MINKTLKTQNPNIHIHLANDKTAANAPTNASLESRANPIINRSFSDGPNNPLNLASSSPDISLTSLLSGGTTSRPSSIAIVIDPSAPTPPPPPPHPSHESHSNPFYSDQ